MRIQETYIGRGQVTITQAHYVPNEFKIEYQYKGTVRRLIRFASWKAQALARKLVYGPFDGLLDVT